jgi:CRP/FNR family transcriptional regulator
MAILTATQQEISYWVNSIFKQFEPELRKTLVENGVLKHLEAGQQLMRPGQAIRSTMLLVEGRVKVYSEGANGDEYFMYYLEPGQGCALSMICAMQNQKSDVAAKTVEASTFIMLPINILDTLMMQYKSWYQFVMESYRIRFHELLESLSNVAFHNIDQRLDYYLQQQVKSFKSNQLHITHEEIAKDINSSRVVVSRLLKQMEDAGKLKMHRNYIELLNC